MNNRIVTIKCIIIRLLSVFFQLLNRLAVRSGISRPRVIIYMDGGICSQMSMYLKGQYFMDVADVLYDTTWFELNGKDLDGRFDRKLELTEMFPKLQFNTINRKESRFYKMFYSYPLVDGFLPSPNKIWMTTYFGGYFDLNHEDLNRLFSLFFNTDSLKDFDVHLPGIPFFEEETKVAVHVRRGDLADREDQWYKKVPSSYFFNAINYVKDYFPDGHLFFFSDEPDWVEEFLCPSITLPYNVIRGNRACEDLYLISLCDVVIASQGSFGLWGARLNGHSTLIRPSDDPNKGFSIVSPLL